MNAHMHKVPIVLVSLAVLYLIVVVAVGIIDYNKRKDSGAMTNVEVKGMTALERQEKEVLSGYVPPSISESEADAQADAVVTGFKKPTAQKSTIDSQKNDVLQGYNQ